MRIPRLIKQQIDIFNSNSDSKAIVKYVNEYITLFIDGSEITSGEIEVIERIKQINKENGYLYDFNNSIEKPGEVVETNIHTLLEIINREIAKRI